MKKIKLLLTMAVIVFATMICYSMSAFALTEGDWEFKLLNNEVTITKYIGENENVVVPETIAGLPVTYLDGDTFFRVPNAKSIKSVEIRANIKELAKNQFFIKENLETVVLPEGIEVIPEAAFFECTALKNINIPSTVKTLEFKAFFGCKALTDITLPAGIESIGQSAFEGTGLKEIDLSNVKKGYGDLSFGHCKNLESVTLSAYVNKLPLNMFAGCEALKSVEIPNGVEYIGEQAFYLCSSLESVILPSSLKEIDYKTFSKTNLKSVIIPYGVTFISSHAFRECKNLEAIYIPDTVTKMLLNPFEDDKNAIVYCSAGSYAEQYCREKEVSYLTDNSVNSGIHVFYNGKRISFHSYGQNPEILEGRTLVPLRSIFEAMGADVEWDGTTSTAIAKRGNVEVKITIGANEIYKNGKAVPVDVPAMLLNSRTMVPARVIAEAFGADVDWNGNGRVVLITE